MVSAPEPPAGLSSHSIRRSCSLRWLASCEPSPATKTVPKESSMTIDLEMAEIAKVFFQESREGLDVMESGLLSLGATADSENIKHILGEPPNEAPPPAPAASDAAAGAGAANEPTGWRVVFEPVADLLRLRN